MSIDLEKLQTLIENQYIYTVEQEYGTQGIDALKSLLSGIRKIYTVFPPESLKTFYVMKVVNNEKHLYADSIEIVNIDTLSQEIKENCVVQILENGKYLLSKDSNLDIDKVSKYSIVYEYKNGIETIICTGKRYKIENISSTHQSMFAIPTFSDLRSALEHYQTKAVRNSSCKILENIWYDKKRIFLRNAQEHVMRDSLTQFLKISFRDYAEVRPEQIVDDSHPVDIKVTWSFSRRLALIEIKWLGTPKYGDGHLGTPYSEKRANEGAKQLANYLDQNNIQAPTFVTRGYLVIIDARRKGLKKDQAEITRENGFHYENQEILFSPHYNEIRPDFEKPLRMFAEPLCQ